MPDPAPPLDVPRSLACLTPAWMTAALAGSFPGAVVGEVRVGPVSDGTNRRAAVHLGYRVGRGPGRVFVKAPGRPLNRLALLALGAVETEARLFGSGVDLPLEHPAAYATAVDRRRLAAVVVMEDVTSRGATPNDATVPLTPAQVERGLAGLASLHARFWGRLPASLGFLGPWRLGSAWAPVSGASLAWSRRRLRRLGGAGLLPTSAGTARLERQFRRWAGLAATGPRTLLHGDPHPGNTYARPGPATGFYDWQLARTGLWVHDVGYFVQSSLRPDDRRHHERDLLAGYLDGLHRHGVHPAPAPDQAWDLYRLAPAYGLCTWLHTLSGGGFQPADRCLATIERFAAAYADLGTARFAPR